MEYNLTIIGPRGSGKTVFLTAVFYKLSKFFTRFDAVFEPEDLRDQLQENLEIIQNGVMDQFPDATMYVKKYEIDFYYSPAQGQRIRLFRVNYIDYPGGYLDQAPGNVDHEFRDFLSNSQSIIVLIDGDKLLKRIDDPKNEEHRQNLNDDLNNIVNWLNHTQQCPTHILISKFDIFDGNNPSHSLRRIKSRLKQHNGFRNFIDNHHRSVHFIGVTSVGDNIIRRDLDGKMHKVQNKGNINPRNVDYAILLVLIDHLIILHKSATDNIDMFVVLRHLNRAKWLISVLEQVSGICGYNLPDQFKKLNHVIELILNFKEKISPNDNTVEMHGMQLHNNISNLSESQAVDYIFHKTMAIHKDYIQLEFWHEFQNQPEMFSR